jgi:hypothetical protein
MDGFQVDVLVLFWVVIDLVWVVMLDIVAHMAGWKTMNRQFSSRGRRRGRYDLDHLFAS